jgi:hypothetical protein
MGCLFFSGLGWNRGIFFVLFCFLYSFSTGRSDFLLHIHLLARTESLYLVCIYHVVFSLRTLASHFELRQFIMICITKKLPSSRSIIINKSGITLVSREHTHNQ